MYEKLRSEYDELRRSKKEIDGMYTEMRAELTDNENLLKTYQKTYDDLGRKYDDALLKIDKMSTNPDFSGRVLLTSCTMKSLTGTMWSIDFSLKLMPKGRRSTAPVVKLVVQPE